MSLIDHDREIEQKQKLLQQHQRNLQYLERQAVQYGLDVPLAVHNALLTEQDAISTLKRDLATLGVTSRPKVTWQAAVIDTDDHWRQIIVSHIHRLGGVAFECVKLTRDCQQAIIDTCAVAIVGIPAPTQSKSNVSTEKIANLGKALPLILMVDWDNRDAAIVLRQAVRGYNINVTPVTIFKETFDVEWFSRIVHRILTR